MRGCPLSQLETQYQAGPGRAKPIIDVAQATDGVEDNLAVTVDFLLHAPWPTGHEEITTTSFLSSKPNGDIREF